MKTSVVLAIFLGVVRTVHGDCDRPTGGPNTELITTVTFPAPDGTSVTFGCDVGYRKVGGSGTVVCSAGTWSQLNMRCEIKNCGSAGEVVNGFVDYSEGTEFGAIAHVVCNEGYVVVGFENKVLCGANGWQGRLASCEVIKCDPPNPIASGYFSPVKDDYDHSEVITYSCEGEHKLNGSKTATCQDNGQFHPAPPKCVLVNCLEPSVNVSNGMVAGGARPPYNHGSSVTFRCVTGYSMEGQPTVTCNINSNWSPAFPKCNLIQCKAPEITNGEVVGTARPTYKYDETVTLKCKTGYKLSGQSTLMCKEMDQWSAALPACTLIECQTPVVQGGVVVGDPRPSYKYMDTVKFECKSGYVLSGESTLTCDVNSQWSPKLPQCTMIECQTPVVQGGVVVGGQRPSYKYMDTVKFECKSGYVLSGESTLTCDVNSQWSPKLPQCTMVVCSSPEVTHGQVVEGARPSYKYLDSVVVGCKSGYTMSGLSAQTCAQNSQWSPGLPQCIQDKTGNDKTGNEGHTLKVVLSVLGELGKNTQELHKTLKL